MRVCLIEPILFSFQQVRGRSMKNNVGMSSYPPLGLCYIANYLRKNDVPVEIIDRKVIMTKNNCSLEEVNEITKNRLKKLQPDIVGISTTTPTLFDVKKNIVNIVRQVNEQAMIVVGGSHTSALSKEFLKDDPDVNVSCRGEGEITMLEIAQGKDLKDIQGISYRDGQQVISNETRTPHDNIDNFCFPARDLLDMKFYSRRNPYVMHGLYLRSTTMFTSRGCPYECTFCAGSVAFGKKVRFQSPDLVVEEIDKLSKDYKMEGLYFADDMFDANKERAKEICRKLIDQKLNKKISWNAQLRANSIDKDFLKLMKEAGCIRVDVGFESGSQKILDIINKKTTVEQNYHVARTLDEVGIPFHANIVVGMPNECPEDIHKTEKFLREIKPDWIGFGEFVPLPGSKLYDDLIRQNELKKEQVENLESFNFTNIDDQLFDCMIKNIRNKIVLPTRIRSYILNNIRRPGAYLYLLKLMLSSAVS